MIAPKSEKAEHHVDSGHQPDCAETATTTRFGFLIAVTVEKWPLWANIDSVVADSASNGRQRERGGRDRETDRNANQSNNKAIMRFAISPFLLALVDLRRLQH